MSGHRSFLFLPFASLIVVAAALAEAPTLSNVTFLPGDETITLAAGMQHSPEIAAGDETYLAVWVDDRTAITRIANLSGGPAFDHHIGSMWDLYAARIDALGNLIDETPIIVAQQIQNQGLPEVAWNGENWLVMWTGQTGLQCCPDENRYAARVSPDGAVLDTPPITLATGNAANALWPGVVGSDGANWLAVWTVGNQVIGRRIAPDGTVLDPNGVVLHTGGYPGDFDIVTGVGGGYLLLWSSGGQTSGGAVMGRRLASDLTPIGGAFACNLYSPSVGLNCRVATNGTDYFMTWWEDRYYGWSQLVGARVSGAGAVLDPGGLPLTDAYGYTNYEPAVEWDGENWVVVYDKSAFPPIDLFATRITPEGVVLDYEANAIPVSTAPDRQFQAAIARLPGATESVMLWRDGRYSGAGTGDICAATFSSDGTVGPEVPVSLGTPRQTLARLTSNGAGSLVTFRSETGLDSRVMAQRLDANGVPIDDAPVEVASGNLNIRNPAAAWNGSEYLVVWEGPGDQVLGRRLAADLSFLDPSPVLLMPGNTPDVAARAGTFLVVATYEDPHEIRKIYSVRMRGSDGELLDATPVVVGFSFSIVPRASAFADRWIVTWQRHPTHDNPNSTVYANFVDENGAPGSPFVVDSGGKQPAVTVGGDQAMFVLVDRNGPTVEDLDILARRMLPNGTFLDAAAFYVSTAVNAQFDPVIAWTGTEYVTAFGDFRLDPQYTSKRGDLYGARVANDGTVIDPTGFAISNLEIPEMFAAASGIAGQITLGGSVFHDSPGYLSYRIGVRNDASATTDAPLVSVAPSAYRFEGARPNPFRASTSLTFDVPRAGRVQLSIYDATGRRVRTLADEEFASGRQHVIWDGADADGRRAGAGVYFVRMEAGSFQEARRIVLLR